VKLMEYLDTARGFGNMLDQLASPAPDPQLLRDLELAGHPALQAFAARSWAERRGSAASGAPQALVLLVAYQMGQHLQRIRVGFRPHILRGALLFLARSVWPPYEVWVTACHPLDTRPSVKSSVTWLTCDGTLTRALRELGVSTPEAAEFRLTAHDFEKSESTYHTWVERARGEVHALVMDRLRATGPG